MFDAIINYATTSIDVRGDNKLYTAQSNFLAMFVGDRDNYLKYDKYEEQWTFGNPLSSEAKLTKDQLVNVNGYDIFHSTGWDIKEVE